jgi:hypothetical protein
VSRRGKIVVAVVLTILGAGVLALLTLYASVSGGWDDAFRPKKTESSGEVRRARERGGPVLDARVREVREAVDAAFGASVVSDDAGPPTSECEEGQHNWKIDDEYDLRCDLVTEIDVRTKGALSPASLTDLDRALRADGWTSTGGGVTQSRLAFYESSGFRLEARRDDGLTLTVRHTYFEG